MWSPGFWHGNSDLRVFPHSHQTWLVWFLFEGLVFILENKTNDYGLWTLVIQQKNAREEKSVSLKKGKGRNNINIYSPTNRTQKTKRSICNVIFIWRTMLSKCREILQQLEWRELHVCISLEMWVWKDFEYVRTAWAMFTRQAWTQNLVL